MNYIYKREENFCFIIFKCSNFTLAHPNYTNINISYLRNYIRAPALNGNETFCQSLADRVIHHLNVEIPDGKSCSPQLGLRCPKCTNACCQTMRKFFNERQKEFYA